MESPFPNGAIPDGGFGIFKTAVLEITGYFGATDRLRAILVS